MAESRKGDPSLTSLRDQIDGIDEAEMLFQKKTFDIVGAWATALDVASASLTTCARRRIHTSPSSPPKVARPSFGKVPTSEKKPRPLSALTPQA